MVSACLLYIDDIELTEQKACVPDDVSALFQESDRRECTNSDDDATIQYWASRESVLKRLDIMGCTASLAEKTFSEWRDRQVPLTEDLFERVDLDGTETLHALRNLTWEGWKNQVKTHLLKQHDDRRDEGTTDLFMPWSWMWFDGMNSLISLRSLVEAMEGCRHVILDVGDLVEGGWIDDQEPVCLHEASMIKVRGQPTGPVIVLTEGVSDREVLQTSLRAFHPDLEEYVTFLNHEEFKVDGGAGYVVKFLKAFAAARVPANIVAVLDNDAVGYMEQQRTHALRLPNNMACIRLPDVEIARNYPSIGPQGQHHMDVNGKACGIEVYLGRSALTLNDELRPVLWNGRCGDSWQGVVKDKEDVRNRFLELISNSNVNVNQEFPEMASVWKTILDAAISNAQLAQAEAKPLTDW